MPVIAVSLSQKTYTEIMLLVGKGAYSGPEQFLEIAAFNQLALERGLRPEELLKGIHRPVGTTHATLGEPLSDRPAAPRARQVPLRPREASRPAASKVAELRVRVEPLSEEIKGALSRFSRPGDASALVPCDTVPNAGNCRIWGQVNRLFPLKAACRWIVNAANNGQWPDLHFVMEKLAPDAAVLGSVLEKRDAESPRKREEMLGTGLPRKGNLQSGDRYLSQFIARVTRSGTIYPGAISDYDLASISREKVILTGWGMELARLENPILDADAPTATLSADERNFLLHHISKRVSAEKQDFNVILQQIAGGNSTPSQLMTAARSHFPSEWTDVVFRTHVYGVLARLSELGVVKKHWQGRMVEYQVADSGLHIVAA